MKYQGEQFTSLDAALRSIFGSNVKAVRTERVTGGDINESCRVVLNDGTQLFMKTNARENADFFRAEIEGLSAIVKTGTIGTPRVLGIGTDAGRGGYAFLLMEFIESKSRAADFWEDFAHRLSDMHRADTAGFVNGGVYGFCSDNYIGARRQANTAHSHWTAFFRDCRLRPQFAAASRYFDKAELKKIDRLLERADSILAEPEQPSLLHGDLWSGNFITGNDGRAWLIDPAAYVGHAEADIAMTQLFGGFPQRFYDAYREASGLGADYAGRRDFYNLYHLLNHLNMFGRSYLMQVKHIVDAYA